MFSLIRRISYSVIPRPDRPWEDDPTSNAPNTRRKRRISSTEHEDEDDERSKKKKIRGGDLGSEGAPSSPIVGATDAPGTSNDDTDVDADGDPVGEQGYTIQREGSLEVKVVTKGVDEVELEDKDAGASTITPAEVPAQSNETATGDTDAPDTAQEASSADATTVNPEAIPLPEEKAGELDEEPPSSSSSSSAPTPFPSHAREDSTTTAVDLSEASEPKSEPAKALESETSSELDPTVPSLPGSPRMTRSSRPSAPPRKLRSKSPKKVSAKA